MTIALQIIAGLALIVLMVYLVPLLIQLRKTAAAVEQLSLSVEKDSAQILCEVQAARARVDEVAELAKRSLDQSTPMSQVVTGVLRAIPSFLGRPSAGSNFFETLMTGIAGAINLFRRAKPARQKEEQP